MINTNINNINYTYIQHKNSFLSLIKYTFCINIDDIQYKLNTLMHLILNYNFVCYVDLYWQHDFLTTLLFWKVSPAYRNKIKNKTLSISHYYIIISTNNLQKLIMCLNFSTILTTIKLIINTLIITKKTNNIFIKNSRILMMRLRFQGAPPFSSCLHNQQELPLYVYFI